MLLRRQLCNQDIQFFLRKSFSTCAATVAHFCIKQWMVYLLRYNYCVTMVKLIRVELSLKSKQKKWFKMHLTFGWSETFSWSKNFADQSLMGQPSTSSATSTPIRFWSRSGTDTNKCTSGRARDVHIPPPGPTPCGDASMHQMTGFLALVDLLLEPWWCWTM